MSWEIEAKAVWNPVSKGRIIGFCPVKKMKAMTPIVSARMIKAVLKAMVKAVRFSSFSSCIFWKSPFLLFLNLETNPYAK